jgi:phosphatidylethanolamine-binding protein (PEBP) family uncharacterized protein
MKKTTLPATLLIAFAFVSAAFGHFIGEPLHDGHAPRYDFGISPPATIVLARADLDSRPVKSDAIAVPPKSLADRIAAPFAPFSARVKTHADEKFFYVESDGLPSHNMMVGITAWQQQVPLPQQYFGGNAWGFPLAAVPAVKPQTIRNHFLRGAIAIAVNGIPIFNPQNNRGEISAEIGELDQWGGHCGRADDYHYHAAPLHLQSAVGRTLPVAYALDGYAIYGLSEPDGATPQNLDSFNGHTTPALGYHYHASTKYPFINGGFHGEVVEAGGQVDPQPRAQSVREALPPLRGARITGFTSSSDQKAFALQYSVNGHSGGVTYSNLGDGQWKFRFANADGTTREATYGARDHRPSDDGPPQQRHPKGDDTRRPSPERSAPQAQRESSGSTPPLIFTPKHTGNFVVTSPVLPAGGALPVEFTGDGAGISPPLVWKGAPPATKSYAIVMDHLDPENVMKCYWTMWDIPPATTSLAKNAHGPGKLGRSFRDQSGYEAPHSQGPGLKTYTIHVYALSESPRITRPPGDVTREVLLNSIRDTILDSAELKVTYTRPNVRN